MLYNQPLNCGYLEAACHIIKNKYFLCVYVYPGTNKLPGKNFNPWRPGETEKKQYTINLDQFGVFHACIITLMFEL